MIGKNLRKHVTIALNVLYAEKEKYILLMFQNITQIMKKVILLMIPNGDRRHNLAVKKLISIINKNNVET